MIPRGCSSFSRALIVVAGLMASTAGAAGIDLHRFRDDRCAECHGHAGAFARVVEGRLRGRHHVADLRQFMQHHYLAANELDAVLDMLTAQATSQARFKQECSNCHASAAEFVRESLVLRAAVLVSRETARPTREFLESHRSLDAEDVEFSMPLLHRVAGEVYR